MNLDLSHFTPLASTAGGVLIGLSAAVMLLFKGRIAGISGIAGGILRGGRHDLDWRLSFVGGMAATALGYALLAPEAFANTREVATPVLMLAGLLVGYGTRLGNGCTSGHGVCGISRGSKRSLTATATFMLTAGLTVYLVQHVWGVA